MAKYNIGVIKSSNNFFHKNICSLFPITPITPKAIQNLAEPWVNSEKIKNLKFTKVKVED